MSDQVDIKCTPDNFKLVPINSIKPNPKNNNRHPIEQMEHLKKLLLGNGGFREPLTVSNQSGLLVCGHLRLEIAKELGMKELPVMFQDFESAAQEYQHMTADNEVARYAQLDYQNVYDALKEIPEINTELLGIENFVIPEVVEPQCDEDEVPEVPEEPKTKLGDIYKLGNHRLMCGDSTSIDAVEKLMDGNKADMVFTDPPYLMSKSGGGLADDRPNWKKYQDNGLADFNPQDFISMLKVLNIPTLYIFCSKDLLKPYIQYFEDSERSWNLLVMAKNNPIPMKNNTFLSDTEWLFFSRGDNATFNNDLEYDYYRKVFNVSVKSSEFGHPTEKQVSIIERFLNISSNNMGTVLDMFGGSGSTLIAAEKTNRKCFMMELDPSYCDVIVDRWEKFTGKKAELING